MSENVTPERTQLLEMYGAQIVYSEGPKGSNGAVELALEMAEGDAAYYMPYQYGNQANPLAHYNGTAPEILEELDEVTAFVAGLGTGGTLMGVGGRLKEGRGGRVRGGRALVGGGPPPQGGARGVGRGGGGRADAGGARPGTAFARGRLHPADHRPLAPGPQDLRHQPGRGRVDTPPAARRGHLRRRVL